MLETSLAMEQDLISKDMSLGAAELTYLGKCLLDEDEARSLNLPAPM